MNASILRQCFHICYILRKNTLFLLNPEKNKHTSEECFDFSKKPLCQISTPAPISWRQISSHHDGLGTSKVSAAWSHSPSICIWLVHLTNILVSDWHGRFGSSLHLLFSSYTTLLPKSLKPEFYHKLISNYIQLNFRLFKLLGTVLDIIYLSVAALHLQRYAKSMNL